MKEHQELPAHVASDARGDGRYEQARQYFFQSAQAAARVNAALMACVGIYAVRLMRFAWEGCRVLWARLRR